MKRILQVSGRRIRGLSLIELMVALLISSIVVLGLVSLINAIGVANRTQDGLARMQENGRFAMQRIASDLRLAGSQHCSKYNILNPTPPPLGSSAYVDGPRLTFTYFNAAATAGNGPGVGILPGVPDVLRCPNASCYFVDPLYMLVGHECNTTTCAPALNAAGRGINRLGDPIPALGTSASQRALGADVLTVRYFNSVGALVDAQRAQQALDGNAEFDLVNDPAVLTREGFNTMAAGDPVWVSNCSTAVLFRGTRLGSRTIQMTGNFNDDVIAGMGPSVEIGGAGTDSDVRAFHVPTSLRTVSYYLRIKNDPKQPGRRISALMRKVDGDAPDQELVEGVERFDLLYGVRDRFGNTRLLTAAQVDAAATCPARVAPDRLPLPDAPGCAWSDVQSVEVYLLVNTVDDVSPTGDDEFRYSWLNTGALNAGGVFENPQALGALRNGLPPGRMLRREFRTTVGLRTNTY